MWVDWTFTQAALCIPLAADTEWCNAAGALVNPLTAFSMVQMALQRGDKVRHWRLRRGTPFQLRRTVACESHEEACGGGRRYRPSWRRRRRAGWGGS